MKMAGKVTRDGLFKYAIECETPNSFGRVVRVVVIPSSAGTGLKVVSVMWVDEGTRRG